MRKSSKEKVVELPQSTLQHYHNCNYGENYAYAGFNGKKLIFTSDRTIELDDNYRRVDEKPTKGFGLEIETECFSIANENAYCIVLREIILKPFYKSEYLFKLQRDGSLGASNSCGVECITQIMTKEFIRNSYPDFKAMFSMFKMFQVDLTQTGNCGMHVNLSNALFGTERETQYNNIKKLVYFVNKHYDFCKSLFRREGRTTYCRRMNRCDDIDYVKNIDLEDYRSDHSVCINLGHVQEGRIELRLVGGQKDYPSFRNTMETIFFLISRINTLGWESLNNLQTIFKGCNQNVLSRLDLCVRECKMYRLTYDEIKNNSINEKYE